MNRVTVALPGRPYDAIIENGILQRAGRILRELLGKDRRLFVITVQPVRRHWGANLLASLSKAGFTAKLLQMPDGEPSKRLATVERLAEQLVRLGADRGAVIVAFGGGVVGDVSGLLASVFMRGVDLVQIPTTVLAQVDASIGGKTGVNLASGKNLLGTFHQPRAVLIDPATLSTLPDREFRSGLYESLKCGVIGNAELFDRVAGSSTGNSLRDPKTLEWIITESVKLKARIVSSDERESGQRQVLNFGHTIGHALEAQSRYRRFLHGEAVGWGMVAESRIAAALGKCDPDCAVRLEKAVHSLSPLPQVKALSREILRFLKYDKKTRNGTVRFVLPLEIGSVQVVSDVPRQIVIRAIEHIRGKISLQQGRPARARHVT